MGSKPSVRHLKVAVRTYVPPLKKPRPRIIRGTPDIVVAFDTETSIDPPQRLLFGSYRVYAKGRLVQEGLIAGNGLPKTDHATLDSYVRDHADDGGGPLRLLSRAEFAEQILWRMGYVARARIVGFNLPFDLSRVAIDARPARKGGFSLVLAEGLVVDGKRKANLWRAEVTVKADGSKRQFIRFTKPPRLDAVNLDDGHAYQGRFLDLHTLAYALTDRSLSLDAAAAEFGVAERKSEAEHTGTISEAYIDYNRQDVRTTHALYEALLAEYGRHPVELDPEQAFSPAAISKAYLRAMGVTPPLSRRGTVTDSDLGHAMTAYYGGRAEVRIRRVPLPVRYLDFTSMYPTVFALMGLGSFLTAASFRTEDASEETRSLVERIDRESLHDPATWSTIGGVFVRVEPGGAILPSRSPYAGVDADHPAAAWTIGINPLRSNVPLWFALPDILGAKLLGDVVSRILEAIRIVPVGQLAGLRPTMLRGDVEVDPRLDDLFRRAIELRQQIRRDPARDPAERERTAQALKTFANGGAYGIFAEYHQTEPVAAPGRKVQASGLWPIDARVRTPEEPGEFCFPPIAASVTAAARLLLALLEADVEAAGGSYVACDTDSLLVVASEDGGLVGCRGGPLRTDDGLEAVRALSWADVDAIVQGLETLNPYVAGTVTSLLKLERENYAVGGKQRSVELFALAISAKRYALYERTPDGPRIRKASIHGLGLYRRPYPDSEGWSADAPAWVVETWERIIREAEGLPVPPEPAWFDLPAISQLAISSPHVLAPFRSINAAKAYADQVKPFGFLLTGHVDPLAPLPARLEPGAVVPVAPYDTDASKFLSLPWRDRTSGRAIQVTTRPGGEHGKVRLKTYRDVVMDHRFHPESKSGDLAGGPGLRSSVGLLPRLQVDVEGVPVHIGKESNRLDEVEDGSIGGSDEVYVEYRDEREEWEASLPALRRLQDERGWRYLAEASGLSERALRYALNGYKMPHRRAREALYDLPAGG